MGSAAGKIGEKKHDRGEKLHARENNGDITSGGLNATRGHTNDNVHRPGEFCRGSVPTGTEVTEDDIDADDDEDDCDTGNVNSSYNEREMVSPNLQIFRRHLPRPVHSLGVSEPREGALTPYFNPKPAEVVGTEIIASGEQMCSSSDDQHRLSASHRCRPESDSEGLNTSRVTPVSHFILKADEPASALPYSLSDGLSCSNTQVSLSGRGTRGLAAVRELQTTSTKSLRRDSCGARGFSYSLQSNGNNTYATSDGSDLFLFSPAMDRCTPTP
ncbi:uncharacterized protein TEOVI_000587200 [Trypanosoma equiperdum]|uniref:Uncharacterized protein n=1 Tax=Trypanosoma equiperdum TaxID=5694 RepID=A0A1G4I9D1_TRYEQ|nr:hypothetical protein, conserved [Trypanosoma equiperdum]